MERNGFGSARPCFHGGRRRSRVSKPFERRAYRRKFHAAAGDVLPEI